MAIHRLLIDLKNSPELRNLFEELHPSSIKPETDDILVYFAEVSLFKSPDRCFENNLDDWDKIRKLVVEMLDGSHSTEITHVSGGIRINLTPLYDFLDELGSLRDFVDDLEELERTLQLFLCAENVELYKQCRDTVSAFTRFMRGIYEKLTIDLA